MRRFIRFFRVGLGGLLYSRIPIRIPHLGKVLACLAILGVACLSYVLGAAVMFFQLPSADFLTRAFTGGQAWDEHGKPVLNPFFPPEGDVREGVTVDSPGQTYDGFTLVTTTQGARATLLDMRGQVVCQWELPFSQVWPRPPHIQDPLRDEQIHWFRCHLFANGDLLAIYQAESDTNYGYGLVKLNKDSKLLWKYEGRVHHDLDVDEKGRIYTLTQQVKRQPPAGLDYLPTPYVADTLVVLSPDGQEEASVPIEEAIRDSAYSLLLSTAIAEQALPKDRAHLTSSFESLLQPAKGDLFHTNSVKVLTEARGRNFPLFQAGQVLISLRNLHTIAVLDVGKRSVVWAAPGPWKIQHDAEFLDNGHLLLFDNHGWSKGCRVIEYDPVTQAIPWVYSAADSSPFYASYRGVKQRLPNGNTLIVDPDKRRLFEVTQGKKRVWENYCPWPSKAPNQQGRARAITGARRYSAEELTFLKGVARARP
jgi:Arylsulfotransferase (ASST)